METYLGTRYSAAHLIKHHLCLNVDVECALSYLHPTLETEHEASGVWPDDGKQEEARSCVRKP